MNEAVMHEHLKIFFEQDGSIYLPSIYNIINTNIEKEHFTYQEHHISKYDKFFLVKLKENCSFDDLYRYRKDDSLPKQVRFHQYPFTDDATYMSLVVSARTSICDVYIYLKNYDQKLAKDVLESYHRFMAYKTSDIEYISDNLHMNTISMMHYLIENDHVAKIIDFNIDKHHDLAAWYSSAKEKNNIRHFNDHDNVPFLYEDHYFIEDYNSAQLYVYKSSDYKNGVWYRIPLELARQQYLKDFPEEEHDLYLEVNIYSKFYLDNVIKNLCQPEFLIIAWEDGKAVKASYEADSINTVQQMICSELYNEGNFSYITSEPYTTCQTISLSHKIASYKKTHLSHKHDCFCFLEFITHAQIENGKITFPEFNYYYSDNLMCNEIPKDIKEIEDLQKIYNNYFSHYLDNLTNKQNIYDSVTYLNEQEKLELLEYMHEKIMPYTIYFPTLLTELEKIETAAYQNVADAANQQHKKIKIK